MKVIKWNQKTYLIQNKALKVNKIRIGSIAKFIKPGIVVQTCNASIWETEAARLLVKGQSEQQRWKLHKNIV